MEMKLNSSNFIFDTSTGVIYEKPLLQEVGGEYVLYNEKYLDYCKSVLQKFAQLKKNKISQEFLTEYFQLHGFTELILKTTDECNLRCKYCIYSDHYPFSSNYSGCKMDIHTAKKAVNYYLTEVKRQQRFISKKPFIAFYGGEPLLNFELIKETIEYTKETFPEMKVSFTITTNGLPLKNKEIVDYLKANSVILCLSIDGYKENHDRNRINYNGNTTYSDIEIIIMECLLDYPLVYSLCCIDPKTNLKKLYDYYMKHDRLSGGKMPHVLRVSQIFDLGTDYYHQFTEKEISDYINNWKYLEREYIELAKKNENNWFLDILIGHELLNIYDRFKFNISSGVYNVNGCCIPGDKIYVLPDGQLSICEKVGVQNLNIGNVETGIDNKRVIEIINNINKITGNHCDGCEISQSCSVCYAQMTSLDSLGYTTGKCDNKKRAFIHNLKLIEEIKAVQPNYFENRIKRAILRNRNVDISDVLMEVLSR